MALMELFYRYCENNEDVEIETKESSDKILYLRTAKNEGKSASVGTQQERDREELSASVGTQQERDREELSASVGTQQERDREELSASVGTQQERDREELSASVGTQQERDREELSASVGTRQERDREELSASVGTQQERDREELSASVGTQQERDREELQETDFPLRKSEQQKEPSGPFEIPQPIRDSSMNDWGNYVKQAETIKGFHRLENPDSLGRQSSAPVPNHGNRRIQIKGKVTPETRSIFRFRTDHSPHNVKKKEY